MSAVASGAASLPIASCKRWNAASAAAPAPATSPGADIPDAYHAFVRTNDATEIVQIINHNLLDLVTLADLMTRLPAEVR